MPLSSNSLNGRGRVVQFIDLRNLALSLNTAIRIRQPPERPAARHSGLRHPQSKRRTAANYYHENARFIGYHRIAPEKLVENIGLKVLKALCFTIHY